MQNRAKINMVWKLIALIAVAGVVIAATSFKGCVKPPELVEIRSIEFLERQDTMISMRIVAVIRHKGPVNAHITNADAKLYLEKKYIGKMNSEQKFKLKARDTTSIPFLATVSLPVLSSLFPVIMKKDFAELLVDGVYSVDLGVSTVKIKSKASKNLDIKAELKKQMDSQIQDAFRLKKIIPKNVDFEKTVLKIDFQFMNPLNIGFKLNSVEVDLFMPKQDVAFGSWALGEPLTLDPKEIKLLSGEVVVNNSKMVKQGMQSIFGPKEVNARGKASVQISDYTFDINIDQSIEMMNALGF